MPTLTAPSRIIVALSAVICVLLLVIAGQCARKLMSPQKVDTIATETRGTEIKTVVRGGETLLVVNGIALPVPADLMRDDISMMPAVAMAEGCDLRETRHCPIYLLSKSEGTLEPGAYYVPVMMEGVDFGGRTSEAWSTSDEVLSGYSIFPSDQGVAAANPQGILVRELQTDAQMGQGKYLLLTRPNATNGVLVFVTNETGEAIAKKARIYAE